jgi:hypothetical protein
MRVAGDGDDICDDSGGAAADLTPTWAPVVGPRARTQARHYDPKEYWLYNIKVAM